MTKRQSEMRRRKVHQRIINRSIRKSIIANMITILVIMLATLYLVANDMEKAQVTSMNDTNEIKENKVENAEPIEVEKYQFELSEYPTFTYSKDWDAEDSYLLAKIAMAEAEGCSIKCKERVILVVLNRVWDDRFPNTIYDVIHENYNGVYQFTPIQDGRWNRIEPNKECYQAVENIMKNPYDESEGALYFESCINKDNWHSQNLEYLYEIDGIRFYK